MEELSKEQIEKLRERSDELTLLKKNLRRSQSKKEEQKPKINQSLQNLIKLVHEKAVELQKVSESVEGKKKEDLVLREEILQRKKTIADLQSEIQSVGSSLREVNQESESEMKKYEKRVEIFIKSLSDLKSEEEGLKKNLLNLDRQIKIHESLQDKIQTLEKAIQVQTLMRESLSKEVSALRESRKLEESKTAEIRAHSEKINESLHKVVKDAQDYYNMMKPYIYEINKFYRVRGEKVPDLIKDWKPKFLITSLHTFKKLKKGG